MRRLLLIVFCFCCIAAAFALSDDKKGDFKPEQAWLPVTPQDWQVKEVPFTSGAPAIQLYFSYYKDDDGRFLFIYRRIKVLTDGGRKYADVEIEIAPEESLKQLAGRTLHPDGTIVEFQGKPFEKTLFKTRGVKRVAKTFAFPEVTVGSILEYRYTVALRSGWVDTISTWPVQSELFTVKEHLRFHPFQGLVYAPLERGMVSHKSRVSYAYLNWTNAKVPEKKQGNLMELELENVPAFQGEEYMPPEDDFKPLVAFFYGGRESVSPDQFWLEWRKQITEYLEKFIGNSGEIRSLAAELTRGETDPEKKLRKLYARTQQIRNLSFERPRTEEESKREGLKQNTNVVEELQHGYGTSAEIGWFFVALARAAGFEAYPLMVSDRKQMSFQKIVLSLGQLDSRPVLVKVNGQDVVLDPGTKYCPYGLVPWMHTSATALRLAKTGDTFLRTPPPQVSLTRRTAALTLAADGSAKGELKLELTGQDALQHRLEALNTDEAGRRKSLEDEVQAWLPNQTVAKLKDSQGWTGTDEPLVATFTLEVPSFASVTGKRMLAPSFLFATFQKNMFRSAVRKYPIVFSYPFSEQDELIITLPEGYSVEVAPYRRKAGLAYAGYETASSLAGNQLTIKRALHVDRPQIQIEEYFELKEFFDIVQKGDESQAVLSSASGEHKR